jgi:oligopeptide transport system permease protein
VAVDPAAQDLDQISTPPGADRTAILVGPPQPWDGRTLTPDTPELHLAEDANTQSVRLIWSPWPEASGYRVYRNIFPVMPGEALGLPLGETFTRGETRFEDRLDLQPRPYYYTVVALNEYGEQIDRQETLTVTPIRVITVDDAVTRGLVDADSEPQLGDRVRLALHPLGTDYLGRDMLARLMHGARVSLFIGIVRAAAVRAVRRGLRQHGRLPRRPPRPGADAFRRLRHRAAVPAVHDPVQDRLRHRPGESGILPMVVALVVLCGRATARLVRGQILQIREEGLCQRARRLLGARTNYLVMRHMIPNTMGVILVTLTFAVPSAIFTEAFLSFIGMGVAPPTPSWGSMCNEGIKTMLTYPHELIFPALLHQHHRARLQPARRRPARRARCPDAGRGNETVRRRCSKSPTCGSSSTPTAAPSRRCAASSFTVEAGRRSRSSASRAAASRSPCRASWASFRCRRGASRAARAMLRGVEIIGQTVVGGRDIRGREIGMIFQDPMSSLNPTMTVGDQIAETLEVHRGWSHKRAFARAVELLA